MERWRDGDCFLVTFIFSLFAGSLTGLTVIEFLQSIVYIGIQPVSTKEEFGFRANYVSSNYTNDI